MDDFSAAAIAAAVPIAGFGLGLSWWLLQIRRAGPIVRHEFERLRFRVVTMRPVVWLPFRGMPFSRVGSGGYTSRVVFRLCVRDHDGREREVWARWGGVGLRLQPDKIELYGLNTASAPPAAWRAQKRSSL